MNGADIQYIEKILVNETNEPVLNITFQEIEDKKREILSELELSKKNTKELLKKLEDYRYVDELQEIQDGRYFRWINLRRPDNIKLTNGGILCEVKIEDTAILVMKNKMNFFFQINMDENLIFQRLTSQEKVILYALDYVNK